MATEMSGVDIGLAMALAMRNRVPNKTTTAQRARVLSNMARGGPAGRAAEDAAIAEREEDQARFMERQRLAAEQWDALQMQERLASIGTERQPPMPNDPMNLAGGDTMWPSAPSQPQFQGKLGGTNAEEEALLAQMQADMANQPGDQGFTSEGYIPGGAGALPPATSTPPPPVVQPETASPWVDPNAPQGFTSPGYVSGGQEALPQATPPPQTPQVAGDTGTSQAQQPSTQGFTSPGYVEGQQAEGGPLDTAGSAALQWLNELFKKDEQPQGGPQQLEQPQVPGDQGFTSPGYVSKEPEGPLQVGQGTTSSGIGGTYTTQHGFGAKDYAQEKMTPEEDQKIKVIKQGFEETRGADNADATISWPTIGDQGQGAQTPGGFQSGGYNPDMAQLPGESFMEYTQRMHQMRYPSGGGGGNADEIIGSLLEKYGSQLKMAGYGEQLEKFSSGNYTKADIDGLIGQFGSRLPKNILAQLQQASDLMATEEGAVAGTEAANVVAEELPGLDPNYEGQQGTTSSGSAHYGMARDAQGNPLGFHAKDYNQEVAILEGESFMDYTKRMHQRNQQKNASNWVDPDRATEEQRATWT